MPENARTDTKSLQPDIPVEADNCILDLKLSHPENRSSIIHQNG
jgi:hypothetical protein